MLSLCRTKIRFTAKDRTNIIHTKIVTATKGITVRVGGVRAVGRVLGVGGVGSMRRVVLVSCGGYST